MEQTRIIVKNLPKYITEDRLKQHFASQGAITDVKLIKTAYGIQNHSIALSVMQICSGGVSRRFAYIGYKTAKECKAAIQHFNSTFIDTAKISVESARPIGDPSLPQAWSKYTKGTSSYNQRNGIGQSENGRVEHAQDSQSDKAKSEAMREAKKSYIDELYLEEEKRKSLKTYLEALQPRARKQKWANDDGAPPSTSNHTTTLNKSRPKLGIDVVVQAVPNKKPGGEGMTVSRSHVTFDDDSEDEYQALPAKNDRAGKDNADQAEESDVQSVTNDDSVQKEPEKDSEAGSSSESCLEQNSASKHDPELVPPKNSVVPLSPADIAADEEVISSTSRLLVLNLPYTTEEEEVLQLFSKFGSVSSINIPLHRETKQSKGMAFVEFIQAAHALAAYKALQSQIFQGRVIIVRGAKQEERKVRPEDGGSAYKTKRLSQLKSSSNSGFNWNSLFMASDHVASAMASKLGVAKSEILDRDADNMAVRLALAETHVIQETKDFLSLHGVSLDGFDSKLRSDTIILVKNLSPGSTVKDMEDLFKSFGDLGRILIPPAGVLAIVEFLVSNDAKCAFRHISYKKHKGLPLLLEWAPKNCFEVAYDPAVHTSKPAGNLETEAPVPQRSSKRGKASAAFLDDGKEAQSHSMAIKGTGDPSNTKLIIRNVPFEATRKDLKQLFSSFAHVKSVRIPNKVTGGHRGFAFAEFLTHSEAVSAAKSLRHTHLYGRRLVIEFAKLHESVDELREKNRQIASIGGSNKRQKVDMAGKYTGRTNDDDDE